jgi:Arg-Lys translocation region protein phosphatase
MKLSKSYLFTSVFNVFIIVFVFFVALIYIEDIYIFRQLEKSNEILPLIYIGRVFIALSFSIFVAVIIFFTNYNFIYQLKNLSLFISNIRNEGSQDNILNKNFSYREIFQLKETFLEFYNHSAQIESEDKKNHFQNTKIDLISRLLPSVFNIKLNPIEKLDISLLPNKSEKSFSDIVDIIETRDGCIICITGSSLDNIESSIYKLKVQTTLLTMKSFTYFAEEEIFHEFFRLANEYSKEKINLFLGYISKKSNKFIYHKFQSNPVFLVRENQIETLSSIGEEFLDKKFININPVGLEFKEGDYLLIISDRLQSLSEFKNLEFSAYLMKTLLSLGKSYKSSKELILSLISVLESWQKENQGTQNILDYLTCLSIRKKIE